MELPFTLGWSNFLLAAVGLFVVYFSSLVLYRLYLHPLAAFPGPRLSAATYLVEMYHDIYIGGMNVWEIAKYHDKYGHRYYVEKSWADIEQGPIVRINPDEIHIKDSSFFDTVYAKAGRADKFHLITNRVTADNSSFATLDSTQHTMRRSALNPFFSRARIMDLEGVIREKVEHLKAKFEEMRERDEIIRIDRGFTALTGDIIMKYAFDLSYHHMDSPDFSITFLEPFMAVTVQSAFNGFFPLIPKVMLAMPPAWVEALEPMYASLFKLKRDLRDVVLDLKSRPAPQLAAAQDKAKVPTVFHDVLRSPTLPESEKGADRMQQEAQTVVGAGVLTSAWTLSVGLFFISQMPEVYTRLRAELETIMPDPDGPIPRWNELERLPFLTACVRESIRLANPVAIRSPRIFKKPLQYKEHLIPAGTPISMHFEDVVRDPEIFPEPHEFRPERWLGSPKTPDGSSLERFLVSFGKGSRSCLGINLAYAELYLTMAMVYRNFRFELYETDRSDVDMMYDFFIPMPKLDSKGIRAKCVKA